MVVKFNANQRYATTAITATILREIASRVDTPLQVRNLKGRHDWCNKGCGMCYPVCGMVHIKEPLLLIVKSSLCGGRGFPLSLSEWSFTISKRKKANILFNDTLNTFFWWLYGIRQMVKDHSDSERRNPLSPYGLLFPISSKGYTS